MSYTCAKFQGNKKNDLSTLVFLNQNSPNFTIISLIFNLKSEFFRIFQKKGPNFRKLRNLTYLELHVIQFWAKKKTFLDHHSSFIHSFIIARTGAVGLGRFRLVHSRWSTAGEKLFFSYFFFLYIFSFFVFFCFFIRIKHSTCKTRGV